jgi:hypothetical protein
MERLREHRLSKEISSLIFGGHRKEFHNASLELFTNEMAVDFQVLRAFMKDRIGRNV